MLDTVNRSELDALKKQLEGIASASAQIPKLSEAIQDVLTAVNYDDTFLMESSFTSLLSCFAEVARDIINRELQACEATKEGIKKGWQATVNGLARENFDELKDVIESFIDKRIASMTKIRDMVVKILEEREYGVENAQQLEDGIRDLRKFREDILKDWPSSSKQPSPINRKAVSEAREAIARGNKGMGKDELIWGNEGSGTANKRS